MDTVRRLVEAQVAPTQDAVVERAVRDLARGFRDELHTRLWEQTRHDPDFQAEMQEIWDGLEADDRLAWSEGTG